MKLGQEVIYQGKKYTVKEYNDDKQVASIWNGSGRPLLVSYDDLSMEVSDDFEVLEDSDEEVMSEI